MKVKNLFQLMVTVVLLLTNASPVFGAGAEDIGSDLRVISSDERGITIEYDLPGFQIKDTFLNGRSYSQLVVPDTVQLIQPGYPVLPVKGALIGVPNINELSINILTLESRNLLDIQLQLAPSVFEVEEGSLLEAANNMTQNYGIVVTDPNSNSFYYPSQPVELADVGFLRDQAVVQLRVNPVQYNPALGTVRVNQRIRFHLSWKMQDQTSNSYARSVSPVFEPLMEKAIFNYSQLDRPAVLSGNSAADLNGSLEVNSAAVEQPALKIGVTEPGIYELTHTEISQAGLDLTGEFTKTLMLSNRGTEIPILVQDGGNGFFDDGDSVIFYGVPITDVYTTKNIYWLSAGSANGSRMAVIDGTLFGGSVPTEFPATLHAEQDSYYWQTMPSGKGQDHWFWYDQIVAPASREYLFTLANIDATAATATIRVRLKGRTADSGTNPDHHTKIYLNDHPLPVDDQEWDGLVEYDHDFTVNHALLSEGQNKLKVESVGDTGASVDQIHVNWFEVDYSDTYVAENNELWFGAPSAGDHKFQVGGFDSDEIKVFDVSDPENVAWIVNTQSSGGGPYRLDFQDTAALDTEYLALTPARYKQPASLELDQATSWRSSGNAADYIIITHQDFYTSSLALADYRSSTAGGGYRVAVVKVQDVYDEFNDGIFNPQAIRDFLSYAYQSWQPPAPVFAVLVGEASYDYRGTLLPPYQVLRTNYVPTQMIEGQFNGQTAYDNWFVQISGDDYIPDMIIGRIPARNASEADNMIAKTIYYEQNPPDAIWNKKATFISDSDLVFESISNQLAGRLPFNYEKVKIYRRDYIGGGDITADISGAINGGSLMVNYIGHGTVDLWAGSDVYTAADVLALTNTNKLSVVTVANCLSGFFVGRANPSMAEAFMRLQNKGAVVVWAPTWFGTPQDHRALMQRFYDSIFEDEVPTLGAAAWIAEVYLYSLIGPGVELLETYAYFGDPATRMIVFPSEEIYLPIVNNGN